MDTKRNINVVRNETVLPEILIHEELPTVCEETFPSTTEVSLIEDRSEGSSSVAGLSRLAPRVTPRVVVGNVAFVTTQGLLTPTPISNQNSLQVSLVTPNTPNTPSTPGTAGVIPYNDKSGFRYNWDPAVHNQVLPIRCKNMNGELHKVKFGSGGKGKCIRANKKWYTPSEFEALSGRGNSKDWKRSIRYAGRTIQCLIEEGILQPHAVTCTCAACCDDVTVSGPVRLFIPYRKRKNKEGDALTREEPVTPEPTNSPPSPQLKDCVVMLTPVANSLSSAPTFTVNTQGSTSETIQVVATDSGVVPTISAVDIHSNTDLLAPVSQVAQTPSSSAATVDFSEQKQWWHLEEMVNTIINYGQQLKHLLEQTKQHCQSSREVALIQLRNQLEQEKAEAVRLAKQEALHSLAVGKQLTVHVQEGIPVDHEGTVKQCANCNRDAYLECADCHELSYCSTFCQEKDWKNHYTECVGNKELTNDNNLNT